MEGGATGENPGRVAMTLEYEVTSPADGTKSMVENRVNARVEIQHDNTYTIVPVIKVRSFTRYFNEFELCVV